MIHHATTVLDGETFNWVSVDGDTWIPINRAPVETDTDEMVLALIEGDGNLRPMVFARRWLVGQEGFHAKPFWRLSDPDDGLEP
jgi:hypothetical protein